MSKKGGLGMSTKDEYPWHATGGGPMAYLCIGSCLTGYKLLKITKHAGKFMHKASYSGLSMNVALLW
ncbi:MAG: hypothetical protein MJE68_04475 [Proteobacteria bacterium]|nr:hypothetical protein [Pseudomonadota bacterium]